MAQEKERLQNNLKAVTNETALAVSDAELIPLKQYRIAFLSQENPADKRTWSGITYHLHSQISRFHHVTWIHANDLSLTQRRILSLWQRATNALGWKFTSHYFLNAFFLGKKIQRKLALEHFDCVVVGAGESELIAHLRTNVPIIYIADTTFQNMVNYYPWHTGLSKLALSQGNNVERKAIQNAAHLIYTSDWAANSAIKYYGASKKRLSILSFGANMGRIPSRQTVEAKSGDKYCRLLFLGVHWERKGGPVVYKTFLELKRRNIACTLTVIGCDPFLPATADLTVIPFLDKNKKEQSDRLFDILMHTDFLFVPTRADCTPVVFSEAAAFGIPVITTQTGGVASVVKEGVNGYCLSMEAGEHEYADLIEKTWADKSLYDRLKLSSRQEYEQRLNWNKWAEEFNKILTQL